MKTAEVRMGLRFSRSDASRLLEFAERIQSGQAQQQGAEIFAKAAIAATQGEPLVVICQEAHEATVWAERFVQLGFERPAVEELSG